MKQADICLNRLSPTNASPLAMPTSSRMLRAEFEDRAHIGKTSFFSLLADPEVQERLEYEVDPQGRAHVSRKRALEFIRELQDQQAERRKRRASHLGVYATSAAPARGRPCPNCRRRISRKAQ